MPHKARRLLRRAWRFISLSGEDRRLFGRAVVALGAVDLGLRTRGFKALVADAEAVGAAAPRPVRDGDLARAQRYAHWLEVASRVHLVPAHCLHRSLALHGWLLREGLQSTLRIGVRKEDGELKAHAWVELGGVVLNDAPAAIAGFAPLAGSGGQRPTWAGAPRTGGREQIAALGGGALSWQ